MLALGLAATAFTPPATRCSSTPAISRRDLFQGAGAALAFTAVPAAFADGANSKANAERARQIYGSRCYRLQTATAAEIVDDANVLTLFITGSYRGDGNKETPKALKGLAKKIVASAKAGDEASAKASLKEFLALGKITKDQTTSADAIYAPKQRRNPGAPPTSEIEAQMGTEAFALYEAGGKKGATGKGYKLAK